MEEPKEDGAQLQSYRQLKQSKMNYQESKINNQAKAQAIALTHKPKYLYPQFNFFELQVNRLASLPEYKLLAAQIVAFNVELDDWKKRNIEIRNLFVTYNLYQNLYSRMKYTSNLVIDRGEAKRAFKQILKWFSEEKPRIRNKAPEKEEPRMKPSTADQQTNCQIDSLLVSTNTKRELKVYQTMARTAHSHLFPPSDRLTDFRRKEIVQGITQQPRPKRAFSQPSLSKIQRYGKSLGSTMTSFKQAVATELKREESKIEPVVLPFELKPEVEHAEEQKQLREVHQEDIEEFQKEKQVAQEQLLQQNIVQVLHEEDGPDEEELFEEEEKPEVAYKKYREDPSADQQAIAEENIKDARQSTLRRILKQKQDSIRSKMEDLKVANHMLNWAAVKARANSEAHTRSERNQLVNRYSQLQFVPKTFQERYSARRRDIPEYQLLFRSKSSHGGCVQREVERHKISSALKTYGRYINHLEIRPVAPENEQQEQELKAMRATSLTCFARQGKPAPFSSIIKAHSTQAHNNNAQDYVLLAKERLAKKGIAVEKQTLMNALAVTDTERTEYRQPFPPQPKLFSNPFFPKHLYQAKPKKKKK